MRRRLLFSLVAILLAIGGGVALRLGRFAEDAVPAPSAAVSPAIPITAGVSATADVPVYLTGLGAVQALNTVTVKVRVDGQNMVIGGTSAVAPLMAGLIAFITTFMLSLRELSCQRAGLLSTTTHLAPAYSLLLTPIWEIPSIVG